MGKKGRKCRGEKGRSNDGRFDGKERFQERRRENSRAQATTGPYTFVAFFVKQVEIGVMLMEFREISANHMLSRAPRRWAAGLARARSTNRSSLPPSSQKQLCGKRNLHPRDAHRSSRAGPGDLSPTTGRKHTEANL